MSILKVFKCHLQSANVVLPSGKFCVFVNGVYRTKDEGEITFFEREVVTGHPHLYIDPNESEVDETLVDPMAMLRHKIIEEYKASMAAAAGDQNRDMGTSDQTQKLNVANSQNVQEAAAGGSGLQLAARLVNLQKPSGAVLTTPQVPVAGPVSEMPVTENSVQEPQQTLAERLASMKTPGA